MRPGKIAVFYFLAAVLALTALGPAHAGLLAKGGQIINLAGQSGTGGTVPLNTMKIILPDGTTPTFFYPTNGTLVVTEFAFNFTASGNPLPPDQVVRLTIGPYEGFEGSILNMTGGVASSNKAIPTGFIIGRPAWTTGSNVIKVSALSDPNQAPIAGSLFIRIKGFTYPPPAGAQGGILQTGSQLINLVGTSDPNLGTVAFNTINIVQADGSAALWSYPTSGLLVVTSFSFAFIASGAVPDETVNLNVGTTPVFGFDGFTRSLVGGRVNGDKVFPTGWVIGPAAWNSQNYIYVWKNGDPTKTHIPGTLIIHLNGYLAAQ